MRKVVTNFLMILLIFSITVFSKNVFVTINDKFTYEDYLRGILEGWIGEDVSYEMLVELQKESKEIKDTNLKGYISEKILVVVNS